MTADAFVSRVEHWRQKLCPEWAVGVTDEDPGEVDAEEQEAWIACSNNDPTIGEAVVYYKAELLDDRKHTKREVDRIIVHELLHPLLDRVLDHDRALEPYIGALNFEVYHHMRRADMEEFVNRVAHVIVDGCARTGTKRLPDA